MRLISCNLIDCNKNLYSAGDHCFSLFLCVQYISKFICSLYCEIKHVHISVIILAQDFCEKKNPIWSKSVRPTLKIFLFPLTQPCFSGMGRSENYYVFNLKFHTH